MTSPLGRIVQNSCTCLPAGGTNSTAFIATLPNRRTDEAKDWCREQVSPIQRICSRRSRSLGPRGTMRREPNVGVDESFRKARARVRQNGAAPKIAGSRIGQNGPKIKHPEEEPRQKEEPRRPATQQVTRRRRGMKGSGGWGRINSGTCFLSSCLHVVQRHFGPIGHMNREG